MRLLALIRMGRPFILSGGILAYGLGNAMGQAHRISIAILLTLPLILWVVVAFTRQDSPVPSSLAMGSVILTGAAGWGVR
jgi:hypothetical protein